MSLSPSSSYSSLFGALRSLQDQAPTPDTWRALCQLVTDAVRDPSCWTDHHDYLLTLAKRWPDAARLAPQAWIQAASQGRPQPWLALAGHLLVELVYWTPAQLDALLHAQPLPQVRHVTLWMMGLRPEHLRVLLRHAPLCAQLQTLNLSRNDLQDEGAALLAQASARLPALRELSLASDDIGSSGAAALAHSPLLERLESLDLSANFIGDEGALALAHAPLQRPVSIELADNAISARGAAELAHSQVLPAASRARWLQVSLHG